MNRNDVAINLERLTAAVLHRYLSDFVVEVTAQPDPQIDEMIVERIRWSFWGLLSRVENVPATWWQAVRERWLPRWWLLRNPVIYRKIKLYGAVYLKPSDDPMMDMREHVS